MKDAAIDDSKSLDDAGTSDDHTEIDVQEELKGLLGEESSNGATAGESNHNEGIHTSGRPAHTRPLGHPLWGVPWKVWTTAWIHLAVKRIDIMLLAFFALFALGGLFTTGARNNGVGVPMEVEEPEAFLTKQVQIANYIQGTALILSIHITHHAGTSICRIMKKLGPTPGFACMGPGREPENKVWPDGIPSVNSAVETKDAETYVPLFRPLFHFVSSEYVKFGHLNRTNWEYDDLVSMIVMRDPLERFLAGGRCGSFHEGHGVTSISGDPTNETQALYWEYANSQCTDNYALRVLANDAHCVDGSRTSLSCLNGAKTLLSRFTFILDQACLSDSMVALGEALKLNITETDFEHSGLHKKHPPTVRERLKNDTLYEFLQHRFRRDIELYQWSKAKSIVQCDQN